MDKNLKEYLQWRFKMNNHNRYQNYRDEWIDNVTPDQIRYFHEEMNRLSNIRIYKGQ